MIIASPTHAHAQRAIPIRGGPLKVPNGTNSFQMERPDPLDPMLKRLAFALPILFVAWIAVLALVMRLGGDAPGAFVPFPPDDFLSQLPPDITITDRTQISLTLSSETENLPARLYEAGAWLVLPAGLQACIPNILRRSV